MRCNTCDVFAELVIVLLKRLDELLDAILINQGRLVFLVLVDDVACGTSGVAPYFWVLAVEQLHQITNATQLTHLKREGKNSWAFGYLYNL